MNEEEFCIYSEWAETELIWGKSYGNWGWAYIKPLPEDEEELKKYEGLFEF